MRITMLQENLLKELQHLIKFIPSKPQLPVLSAIHLQTTEGKIVLHATDLNTGIECVVPGKVEEEGEVAIPARTFVEYISTLSPGSLTLKAEGESLQCIAGSSKAKIQCLVAKEYPPFPQAEESFKEFDIEEMKKLVDFGGLAASLDESRPVFASILFRQTNEGIIAVTTDGYRLSIANAKKEKWGSGDVLLSAKVLREAMRIIERRGGKKAEIAVSSKVGQVFLRVDDLTLLLRLIEGNFPNYENIIPPDFAHEIVFAREEFLAALKTTMIFSRDVSGVVSFSIQGKELFMKASSASVGEQEMSVPITVKKGEDATIAFNGKYLMEYLSSLSSEDVSFSMNEPLKPGMFKGVGDEEFTYIVMPFRLQG